ncbi:DUF4625 domain-containing protein [Seonamhaeicola algicola]|uniref:DUF4625 domain-containing protein n=1 Tax=Seonamhaeicola algicola TaxID=1719036 RepID=A0A5C7AT88_9FLAO|nr:DUF4625 domain-containing protein [Seonamhaeicola algicola]TXE11930.1 DUF4625 domain-containing protein [Seonamhaeicola algicola]
MKTNLKRLAIFAFLGIALFSCSDDDSNPSDAAPQISDFEFGEGSAHSTEPMAYIGSDIHMEAEIYAENKVSSVTVDIHAHDLPVGEGEEEWDYEITYTDESLKAINAELHKHIDIPATAPAGEYHITLTVVDELGNSTEVEGHIDIVHPTTLSNISIDETVVRGEDFHLEFDIEAVNGIHSIMVDVHAHGLTVGEGETEWDEEKIFSEGYHEKTEAEFHEHIDVPTTAPAGEYHIEIAIEDEDGVIKRYEAHIDVTKP